MIIYMSIWFWPILNVSANEWIINFFREISSFSHFDLKNSEQLKDRCELRFLFSDFILYVRINSLTAVKSSNVRIWAKSRFISMQFCCWVAKLPVSMAWYMIPLLPKVKSNPDVSVGQMPNAERKWNLHFLWKISDKTRINQWFRSL